MSVEAVLYILLGFLLAVFLVLLLAPVVWNRAAVLTERKVKATLPVNLSDMEAEKDKLRAEHAMTVRRLEMGIDDLRTKSATLIANLHGKRDENNKFKAKSAEDDARIAKLERASEDMREKLAASHSKVEELSSILKEFHAKYEMLDAEHGSLRQKHSDVQEELSRAQVDILAKEARIESLSISPDGDIKAENEAHSRIVESLSEQIANLNHELLEKGSEIVDLEARIARQSLLVEQADKKNPIELSPRDRLKSEADALSQEIRAHAGKRGNLKNKPKEKDRLRRKIMELSESAEKLVAASGNGSGKQATDTVSNTDKKQHASLSDRIREIQAEINSGE